MIPIIAVSVTTFVFFFYTNFYAAILIFLLFPSYSYLPVLAAAPDILIVYSFLPAVLSVYLSEIFILIFSVNI